MSKYVLVKSSGGNNQTTAVQIAASNSTIDYDGLGDVTLADSNKLNAILTKRDTSEVQSVVESPVVSLKGKFYFEFVRPYSNSPKYLFAVAAEHVAQFFEELDLPFTASFEGEENGFYSYIFEARQAYREVVMAVAGVSADVEIKVSNSGVEAGLNFLDEQHASFFCFMSPLVEEVNGLEFSYDRMVQVEVETNNNSTVYVTTKLDNEAVTTKAITGWGMIEMPYTGWDYSTGKVSIAGDVKTLTISDFNVLHNWGSDSVENYRFRNIGLGAYVNPIEVPPPASLTNYDRMFEDCVEFTQDISGWDVSNATSMVAMFKNTPAFNRDLSGWDVTKIPTEPTDFATGSALIPTFKPRWGGNIVELNLGTFTADGALDKTRVNVSVNNNTVPFTLVNTTTNEVVGEYTDVALVSLTGQFQIKCKESAITELGATVENVTVVIGNDGVTSIDAWSEPKIAATNIGGSWPMTYLTSVPKTRPNSTQTSLVGFFAECKTFNDPNVLSWNMNGITNVEDMFTGTKAFNQDISGWNVSTITNFRNMFSAAEAFNQPIGRWNTTAMRVTDSMFQLNKVFNQPLDNWKVDNVVNMTRMFNGATAFDQDLSMWCVTNVTTAPELFAPSLSTAKKPVWGTCPFRGVSLLKFTSTADDVRVKLTSSAGVEQYTYIIDTATGKQVSYIIGSTVINVGAGDWTLYCKEDTLTVPVSDLVLQVTGGGLTHVHEWSKQPIGEMSLYNQSQSYGTSPNLIKVPNTRPNSLQTSFNSFLNGASRFNDPSISEWDMSGVTNLTGFFGYCDAFDQPLDGWNTSDALYMAEMFRGAKVFNQPLNSWDVSKVRNMSGLFQGTNLFNQPLDSWNTGSATKMEYMFAETMSFNQPLDNWDVSNVTTMRRMFWFASAFDQPLPSWKVGNVTDMEDMFSGTPEYDYDLSMWCVTNITSRPPGFRDRQGALILDPVWGTCPTP